MIKTTVHSSNIMKYHNRLMPNEDDSIDMNIMVDNSETSPLAQTFSTLQNPIFIPSLIGSVSVFFIFLILCRSRINRLLIIIFCGNGFYRSKSSNSKLKRMSKQGQYHLISSLSKP